MRGKSRFKIISVITIVSILLTLIPIRNIIIKAENKSDPSFSIEEKKGMIAEKDPSILGDDITIRGTIEPQSFEVQSMEQELVIILDVSKKEDKTENGNNSNKITTKLKNTIDQFVGKNNNIKLKIGIIIYSDESKILLQNNKKLIDASEFKNINGLFNSGNGNNGNNGENQSVSKVTNKNIGDALRQAIYLLNSNESNPNANKTILLIAEGKTDTRRIDSNGNFCLDTTKENIENTQIVTDDSEKNLEYTKALGNIIKDKGYNVFTMAIDIDKNNEKAEKQKEILKQIHSSMTGYTDLNNTNCEEKGLFLETRNPSNNKSDIEIMLEDILSKFKSEYYLNNVSLNFEFDNDITLKSGGNSIKLENIKYTLDERLKIYKADSIPFSFVIKAKKVGDKQNVFQNLNISYLWKNKNQTQALTSNINITVQNNNYPNISAKLREPYLTANPNDIITLQYDIEPKEIIFNNLDFMKKEIGEVIFILDTSSKINTLEREFYYKNAITNKIIDNPDLANIKFGVIAYDEYCYIGDRNIIDDPKNVVMKQLTDNINLIKPLFYISNGDSKDGYRILFQENKIKVSNYENRNLDNALNTAKYIFDEFGEKDKGKAIVLISSGNNIYSEDKINLIKDNGYKIISLDISNEFNTDLMEIHKSLGGIYSEEENSSDYLIGYFNGSKYSNPNEDIAKVAERLKNGVIDKDKFITPKFTFDLNNNFEYVEASNDNISLVSNKDNKLEFALNKPIEYRYSGEMVDGKYKFIADEQTISFKVKVKDSKLSNLTFGSNTKYLSNYMSYKNFSKEEVKVALTTPEVTLIQKVSNVSHGLYNGIVNNKVDIKENTIINDENNSLKLSEKSTLVMGSTFNTSSNSIDVSLNIDDNFEVVKASDIIVYKVINNNEVETIERVGERENSGNYTVDYVDGRTNKFNISINNFNDKNEDTKILIVYKGSIKDNISNETLLKNAIDFTNGVYKDFSIKINTDTKELPKLPDLF